MIQFKFELEKEVVYKGIIYTIIGRAQYAELPENKFLLQRWDKEIGLDFCSGVWVEENEIKLK